MVRSGRPTGMDMAGQAGAGLGEMPTGRSGIKF
jgi:hypothetical protein